ncbi:MAG TPA: hypothetical protein VHT91_13675 [Kofleriaceae bacterium]|jgi:hypothetical protein|nr:hypothetical protein [Kofleriaceae bacterium]
MSKVSLRRLLSKLAAVALSTSAAPASVALAAADPPAEAGDTAGRLGNDVEDGDGDLDASLPIDREQLGARDAAAALGRSLALALGELRPLTATHLAATWSLSDDPLRRLAVAHALEWTFPLVGDALVIDHLSRDTDPQVRAASARAAWARRAGGDPGVLARLSLDPDPEVREVATSGRPA